MTGHRSWEEEKHRKEVARALTGRTPVTVTNDNADFPATWTGRVIAIINEPAMLLVLEDGNKIMLPLRFSIGEAKEDE